MGSLLLAACVPQAAEPIPVRCDGIDIPADACRDAEYWLELTNIAPGRITEIVVGCGGTCVEFVTTTGYRERAGIPSP